MPPPEHQHGSKPDPAVKAVRNATLITLAAFVFFPALYAVVAWVDIQRTSVNWIEPVENLSLTKGEKIQSFFTFLPCSLVPAVIVGLLAVVWNMIAVRGSR